MTLPTNKGESLTMTETPRGTDMANLSETAARLRWQAHGRGGDCEAAMIEAAIILDRLTVDGLAGVIAEAHDGWARDNSPLARPAYIAQSILDFITAPSGEGNHD